MFTSQLANLLTDGSGSDTFMCMMAVESESEMTMTSWLSLDSFRQIANHHLWRWMTHITYLHVVHLTGDSQRCAPCKMHISFRTDLGHLHHWTILLELLKTSGTRMLEVGVNDAQMAEALLHAWPSLQYLGVDPYPKALVDGQSFSEPDPEKRHAAALLRLMRFPGRAHLLRASSPEVAPWIQDGSLDLLWIDGEHTYSAVTEELRLWVPKLRRGGIVAGHDYEARFPGVVCAVHDFLARHPSMDGHLHLAPHWTFFWTLP
eukprot:gnl/TRDRNA2_/TRDRNA2_78467_c1_seq1.p1 gnl/TRDRNA2_/TRDRNA2_78467_c1~~gnl/TRDRNA2_/TRDRNA2_78467_c1_seq1.p1  ORF type:complete len:261 (+),score=27.49 gnl/TRDRNA2_/TRDRNA2_78467_c1_seq1:1-783(+)